jgi:hypothetical protein
MDPTVPVGSDIVATGSGTIDLTGLGFLPNVPDPHR